MDGWAQYGAQPPTRPTQVQTVVPRPLVALVEAKVSAGTMTATFGPPPNGIAWLVRRITVSVPAPTNYSGRAFVFVGQAVPEALVMGTRSGAMDYALEDPPLFVPETTPLTITWDAGATRALARIEYQET